MNPLIADAVSYNLLFSAILFHIQAVAQYIWRKAGESLFKVRPIVTTEKKHNLSYIMSLKTWYLVA